MLNGSDPYGDFIDLGGGLLRDRTSGSQARPACGVGWNVDDLTHVATTLRASGIQFTIYEGMGQDELGIWTSPDGKSQVAYFNDPDGNVLSLSQA